MSLHQSEIRGTSNTRNITGMALGRIEVRCAVLRSTYLSPSTYLGSLHCIPKYLSSNHDL